METRSLSLSIALHALVLLIAAVGLPMLLPKPPEPVPMVMTVELLPISEMTNVKPSDQSIQKEQKAPTPEKPKPVLPPVQKSAPTPPPPTPAPKPEEKHFDPEEGAEPDLTKKPVEKPKEKEPAKPKQDDFQALLNKLKQEEKTDKSKDAKDKTNTQENKTKSDAAYDDSMPLSISEKDMIRSQFLVCWRMPAGAKDAHSLAVRIKLQLQQDGTVLAAAISSDQMNRYSADTYFRAAADSALRAVHQCSPIKNLPPDKYGSWKDMELNFDPADM